MQARTEFQHEVERPPQYCLGIEIFLMSWNAPYRTWIGSV